MPGRNDYRKAIESKDFDALRRVFAPDARLFTPISAKPIQGREKILGFLQGLLSNLGHVSFDDDLNEGDGKALTFKAPLGPGLELHVCDLLKFGNGNMIVELQAYARPIQALNALQQAGFTEENLSDLFG